MTRPPHPHRGLAGQRLALGVGLFSVAMAIGIFMVWPGAPGEGVRLRPAAPASQRWAGLTVHDFGYVRAGTPVQHRFVLTNRSASTMHVDAVASSCSCTDTDLDRRVIPPGEELSLLATVVFVADPRPTSTDIVVKMKSGPPLRLTLRAVVRPGIPARIDIGTVFLEDRVTRKIRYRPLPGEPIRPTRVMTDRRFIFANVAPAEDDVSDSVITLQVNPEAPVGPFEIDAVVELSDGQQTIASTTVLSGRLAKRVFPITEALPVVFREGQARGRIWLQMRDQADPLQVSIHETTGPWEATVAHVGVAHRRTFVDLVFTEPRPSNQWNVGKLTLAVSADRLAAQHFEFSVISRPTTAGESE